MALEAARAKPDDPTEVMNAPIAEQGAGKLGAFRVVSRNGEYFIENPADYARGAEQAEAQGARLSP